MWDLRLENLKTVIGAKEKLLKFCVYLDSSKIQSRAQTRHLGAIIDSDLSFYSQIKKSY